MTKSGGFSLCVKGTHCVLKARSNVEIKERGDQEGTQLKGGPESAHSAGWRGSHELT